MKEELYCTIALLGIRGYQMPQLKDPRSLKSGCCYHNKLAMGHFFGTPCTKIPIIECQFGFNSHYILISE